MTPRLLVLTAGFGEGHNAAARAIEAACSERHGNGSARLADPFALAAPRFNEFSRRCYLSMINRAPGAWSSVYAWADRSVLLPKLLRMLYRERRVLRSILREYQPTAICSTYPVYGYLLEQIARGGGRAAPHFNVVTDSISINSLWWRSASEAWFLPNADSASVLQAAGIEPDALQVMGFPVTSFFADNEGKLEPPDLQAGAMPRVLYIINSRHANAAEGARQLLLADEWEVTCAVGRNDALRKELTELAQRRKRPATILGWTDRIPRLLMTHHVVVSKAGGATTQEALAGRCPMVVNQIVPGQEEGNYELLRRYKIGVFAAPPESLILELRRAFALDGKIWRQWRDALEPLCRPHAARDIVQQIVGSVSCTDRKLRLVQDTSPTTGGVLKAGA